MTASGLLRCSSGGKREGGGPIAKRATPTPNPSPEGGGEQTECAETVVISDRESRRTKQDRGPPGGVVVIAFIPQEAQRGVGGAPTGALFRLSRLRDATIRACEARRVPWRGKADGGNSRTFQYLAALVSQQCPGENEAKVFSTVRATHVLWAR
jgi:hypothetical protein